MKRPDLPVYYYHDHFLEMLSFVRTTYRPILTDEHDAFVLRFQSLSKDAQCLLIRMVNRRGAIFNRTLFRYAEISDVERAADDLLECGQARTLKADDYAAFVACLPKDILVTGAKVAGRTDIRVSWPKAKLVDYFLAHVPFEIAAEHCRAADFIALDDVRPLEFLLYLYFGSALAIREKSTALVPNTPTNPRELVKELRGLTTKLNVQNALRMYGQALSVGREGAGKGNHFFLLRLEPQRGRMNIEGFPRKELERASARYLEVERQIEGIAGAEAVLVSVDSLAALERAYPNYFLDTDVFLTALQEAIK